MINLIDKLGILYKLKRRRLLEKVKTLNQDYGKNWFFVVTEWKDKEKYAQYGETFVRKEVPAILKKRYFFKVSNCFKNKLNHQGAEDENKLKSHISEVQTATRINRKDFETLNQETGGHHETRPNKCTGKQANKNNLRPEQTNRRKPDNKK